MIKKCLSRLDVLILSLFALFAVSTPSFAALDLTGVTFPMTDCESIASLILAALASLWVIRKVISLVRSR